MTLVYMMFVCVFYGLFVGIRVEELKYKEIFWLLSLALVWPLTITYLIYRYFNK